MAGRLTFYVGLVAALCSVFPITARADEVQQIRTVIGTTFDRPGAKVVSDPVVIEQDYAVADWTQGDKGGRALLRKQGGHWLIALCAGDSLRSAEGMARAGVPSETALRLSKRLELAEHDVPQQQLEMFGRFRPDAAAEHHHGHH
jgi:hypothetical protein